MPRNPEVAAWTQALKKLLKTRKISYRDLARELRLSESGVKKILNAEDLSLGRLARICSVLGISVADFVAGAGSEQAVDVRFTDEQQAYFVKNMDCFRFFWKLAFERQPVERIRAEARLTEHETYRYLKKLDDLGLVRLDAGNRVRVPKLRRVRDFGDGPLIRKLYREWSRAFMEEIAQPGLPPDRQFIFRYFKVRKETYQEFLSSLRELEQEFLKRAIREMSLYPEEIVHMRWISAADSGTFVGKL